MVTAQYRLVTEGLGLRPLDPVNAWAQIGLAAVDIQVALNFLPDDQAARLAAAKGALIAALSLAPENSLAHLLLGVVQMHTNRASEGVRTCERALQLDLNLAAAHAQIGNGKLRRRRLGANAPPEPRPFSLREAPATGVAACSVGQCPPLQPFPQALPGCPAATGVDPSDEPPPPGFSALFQRSIFGYRLFGFCSLSDQFGELRISFS